MTLKILDSVSKKRVSKMFIMMANNCSVLGDAMRNGIIFNNPQWGYEIEVSNNKKYQLVLELKEVEKINCKEIDPDKFEPYQKLPVIVGAFQTDEEMEITTLEGTMKADVGDYIIKGVEGEIYPCKPDIFEKTYKKVYPDEEV